MSKKRGLSLEEKRDLMLETFHETRDVFVLKDVEKFSVKKGIVLQSVKEVLQSLVDDDLVHQEKIGSSNYFWSFPSETAVTVQQQTTKLERQLQSTLEQKEQLTVQLAGSREGKEDTAERTEKLAIMHQQEARLKDLESNLALFAESDPEKIAAIRNATDIAKAAANRWLDNTYALQSWCNKRFEGMEEQLGNLFKENGLSDDIDYLE